MYRLLIVEDKPEHARIIEDLVVASSHAHELSIEHASNRADLEALLSKEPADIVIVDIDLGPDEPTGIEVVQKLFPAQCGTQVIYVSGYVEFCSRVYSTEHVFFLVKPLVKSDFDDALDKAFAKLEELQTSTLAVRADGRVVLVKTHAISYCESDKRKVRIHADADVIETYATLSGLAKQLPGSFIQCHKSFLINMDQVVELHKDHFVLRAGEVVPISQKRRKGAREAFFRHLGRAC